MDTILNELKDHIDCTSLEDRAAEWDELEKYARPETINLISLMVGRFQPFTVTDLENLKMLKEETGNPSTLVYIRSHQWYANTPFKSSTVRRMLEKVKETYPDLVESVVCSDEWDPSDVLKKHGIYANKSIVSDHNSVKAAVTRLALSMGAENEFKRCTPECIHEMYQDLRNDINRDK